MKKIFLFNILFLCIFQIFLISDVSAYKREIVDGDGIVFLLENLITFEQRHINSDNISVLASIKQAGIYLDDDYVYSLSAELATHRYFNDKMQGLFIGAYLSTILIKKYTKIKYTTSEIIIEENWHFGISWGIKIGYKYIPFTFNDNKMRFAFEPYCSASSNAFEGTYSSYHFTGNWLSFGLRGALEFTLF